MVIRMDSIAKLFFGSLILLSTFCAPVAAQTVEYVHTDALGSVVAITNQVGQVIERTRYEPYGAELDKKIEGVGYTGHVMDEATGFVNMQQRYYDPAIGRFLSVDPVTASSGTGANFNRYWYANNNPYRFTDPDGRLANEEKEPPPAPEPTILPTVTATATPASQPTTLGTVTVIAPRMEPIGRPIPWGGIGAGVSSTAGAWISAPFLLFFSPHPCRGAPCGEITTMTSDFPRGVWPGPSGAEEWGRRNGVGPQEGRRRFHEIKQREKGQGGGRGKENYGVNPDTGEVVNPAGEEAGNLGDGQAK